MNSNYSAQEKNFATALLHNLWKYLFYSCYRQDYFLRIRH